MTDDPKAWCFDPDLGLKMALERSAKIMSRAISTYQPTHIVSMVSGGKDSATSHAVAKELGLKIDLIIHGNTRCGIPETTNFVKSMYGNSEHDFAIADAGSAYEDYVLRKGFFGRGIAAHGFAYRVLKATPFRKIISRHIRKRRRDVRILLLNGARASESINRSKNLQIYRPDPAQKGNIWCNIIHDWSAKERNDYIASRKIPLNPVARILCRSGECMCGTMQTKEQRAEAALFYPEWGKWMDELEIAAYKKHGFGWGETFPRHNRQQIDMFQPMCSDCVRKND